MKKTCTGCKESKPATEYHSHASTSDGLRTKCKPCRAESGRAYRSENVEALKKYAVNYHKENAEARGKYTKAYYRANIEAKNEYHKKYRKDNAEAIKQKRIENSDSIKQYRIDNRLAINERNRIWRKNNMERQRELNREWRAANPEADRVHKNARRARIAGNGGSITTDEWLTVKSSWLNRCASCGTKEDIAMDHIISIKMGGPNSKDNVQPLCTSCNSTKGAKCYSFLRSSILQRKIK